MGDGLVQLVQRRPKGWTTRVHNRQGQEILLFSIVFRPNLGSTQALPPGVNLHGREADQKSPSNAEVKNGEAITPLPHMS
jgi:hypothetical protein